MRTLFMNSDKVLNFKVKNELIALSTVSLKFQIISVGNPNG